MAYSSQTRRGLGVIPAALVVGVVGGISKLFGPKSGKTTHAQRFGDALQANNLTLAKTLVDQAYSHAFVELIADKADWVNVWNAMLQMAQAQGGDILAYMQGKVGAPSGTGGTSAVQGTGLSLAGMGGGSFLTLALIGLGALALAKFAKKRG
jgi:hypothetical protein